MFKKFNNFWQVFCGYVAFCWIKIKILSVVVKEKFIYVQCKYSKMYSIVVFLQ